MQPTRQRGNSWATGNRRGAEGAEVTQRYVAGLAGGLTGVSRGGRKTKTLKNPALDDRTLQ
jgi:hypothetical protein